MLSMVLELYLFREIETKEDGSEEINPKEVRKT